MAQLERTTGASRPAVTSLAIIAGALGVLALITPLRAAESPGARVGFLLAYSRENADVAGVVAVMAIMVLIGTLADRLVFGRIEKRVRRRFGLA